MDTEIKVLLVEDNPGDVRLVREMLSEGDPNQFCVTSIDRLAEALRRLSEEPFDVILLDLSLPDSQGLWAITQIQIVEPSIPIVVLSGHSDETLAFQAVQCGAQDYLVKGQLSGHLLGRSLRYAIERRRSEERLHYMAHHDNLTGLPNRALFYDRLSQALTRAPWHQRLVAVMFLDLDRFKIINDTLGHDIGDLLLKAVVERLTKLLRDGDTMARLGGDEFTFVFTDIARDQDIVRISQKLLEGLANSFQLEGHEVFITTSVGVSVYPTDGDNPQTLLKNADIAMYRAKEQGRNNYQLYSSEMNSKTSRRLEMENHLRHALERNEFFLHYQPQVDIRTGEMIAMEALLRWRGPDGKLVPPIDFIPLAEETGLIESIGAWVLRAACEQQIAWRKAGLPAIQVGVNISARQFHRQNLVETVTQILEEVGVEPRYLQLELTESLLMKNTEAGIETLRKLNSLGIEIAIDDFGTGYSSLSYLKRFPISRLKIDQSFIRQIPSDTADAAIVTAIITLAHALKLKVIAEAVETEEQLLFLQTLECDEIQGYLFSKPLPPEQAAECLRLGKRLEARA